MPFYERWFSLSARRGRRSYIFASLALIFVIVILYAVLLSFNGSSRAKMIIALVFIAPAAVAGYTLTAQRLRDFNVTGWLALLWIPIGMLPAPFDTAATLAFWIVLCGVPGTDGQNEYGDDPLIGGTSDEMVSRFL